MHALPDCNNSPLVISLPVVVGTGMVVLLLL
jgi:hypothetical protein